MKFLIVLAVAVACAAADVSHIVQPDSVVPIIKSSYDINLEGNGYNYVYETANGIKAQAEGVLVNPTGENPSYQVKGGYQYTAPDGTLVDLTYIADENGFQPSGSHIPVAPPISEAILRSIAYNAANAPVEKPYKP